jgi:hypothetical protein
MDVAAGLGVACLFVVVELISAQDELGRFQACPATQPIPRALFNLLDGLDLDLIGPERGARSGGLGQGGHRKQKKKNVTNSADYVT